MTQLTYYEENSPEWEWWTTHDPQWWSGREGIVVRYGYTMADLDRAARMALARNVGVHAFSRAERYEIAWDAIVMALYEAPGDAPPTLSDLASAGWYGISHARVTEMRHHGIDHTRHVGDVRPHFATYWHRAGLPLPPEERLIERLALEKIWETLTEGQRSALAALALHGTATAAAKALGKTTTAFHRLARAGRQRFIRLWFEGESAPPRWGRDRRRPTGEQADSVAAYRASRRAIRRRVSGRAALTTPGEVSALAGGGAMRCPQGCEATACHTHGEEVVARCVSTEIHGIDWCTCRPPHVITPGERAVWEERDREATRRGEAL